jgi:hypothetical protein
MSASPPRFTLAALNVLALVGGAVLAAPPPATASRSADPSARLGAAVQRAVDAQHYQEVLDTAPPSLPGPPSAAAAPGKAPVEPANAPAVPEKYDPAPADRAPTLHALAAAKPIHQMPNVDTAVIELDDQGHPTAAADVLLSPQYPHGVTVPLGTGMSTEQVRWRRWDDTEWDRNQGRGTTDVLSGREQATLDFASPYPASVLKLMVAFGVLRLVDRGVVSLDGDYAYQPVVPRAACGPATTKTVRRFLDEMITVSRNESACALIKLIHDAHAMDELNSTFAQLGMPTLQLAGTNPANGGVWGGSNMGALDTAKLLLIVGGGPGTLWTAPDGTSVTRDVLSDAARDVFLRALGDQGHNDMLSTTNYCGRPYPAPGIPQVTPARWVNPQTGTVTVAGAAYGRDVRPCDAAAEVSFAHKTGWVNTTGGDAGIVHSLPGKAKRNYIVVVFTNLGLRYVDAGRPADPAGIYPVPYTEKHATLGRAIDTIMKACAVDPAVGRAGHR